MGDEKYGGERREAKGSEPHGSITFNDTAKINKRKVGAAGETAALSVYLERGYTFLARNWHYRRLGELDLILFRYLDVNGLKEPFLVVCEVKCRNASTCVAAPGAAVTKQKQNKIRRLTSILIQQNRRYQNVNVRFDVAEVYVHMGEIIEVEIIENAF